MRRINNKEIIVPIEVQELFDDDEMLDESDEWYRQRDELRDWTYYIGR